MTDSATIDHSEPLIFQYLLIGRAGDEISGRVRFLGGLNSLLDPPVEHFGGFKAVAARRQEDRGIKPGRFLFLELRDAICSVDADADHRLGGVSAAFQGSHTAENGVIVVAAGEPSLDMRMPGEENIDRSEERRVGKE